MSPLRLTVEDKLDALRKLDPKGKWQSLDDERYCTRCDHGISGRQIEVAGGTRAHGPLRLECPTAGCVGTPEDWTRPPRHGANRTGTDQDAAGTDNIRVEIRGETENISITSNGRAAVIRRSRSTAGRRGANWLARSVVSVAADCRSLLGQLRPSPRGNFYPVH